LWRDVAEQQTAGDRFFAAVSELTFAALLVEPLIAVAEITAEAMVVLTESGWHDGASGAPVPLESVEAVARRRGKDVSEVVHQHTHPTPTAG
jgi:hypothetical protein